jgi:hypothetical protein
VGHFKVEYEKNKVLYSFIGVLKNPKMHWSNSSSWDMVEFIYAYVTNIILTKFVVSIANYVALGCDHVNIVDNGN